MAVEIGLATDGELEALHVINEASTPGVGSVPAGDWPALAAMCTTLVARRDGAPAGMIMLMFEGLAYDSLNYAWITEHYDRFAYVDRIAIAPDARGQGIGQHLYQAAFDHLAGQRDRLLCEVNLAPPNPGSLRFHRALGFADVGQRWLPDRSKGVVYLERKL
jgi:predicted GNAT superfamily acetyltransferase